MSILWFILGCIFYFIFAYDIEHDRDIMTWVHLFISGYFFVNSYMRYQYDKKNKGKDDNNIMLD